MVKETQHGAAYDILRGEIHKDGYRQCIYCGEPADTLDHVPPKTRVYDYRSLNLIKEYYFKVYCCKECNNLLSDTLQDCLFDRIEVLKAKLYRRYRRYLKIPEWEAEELAELGKTLKEEVLSAIRLRDAIEYRLDYSGGQQILADFLDRV